MSLTHFSDVNNSGVPFRPRYAQVKSLTRSARAIAANASLVYTCPAGVKGSIRAARLARVPT